MKSRVRMIECIVACAGVLLFTTSLQNAVAQDAANPPYLNPQLSPEQRATDLVHRMTLSEKATQMQNNSAEIQRLKVPAYQWWSEALHGVINEGVTEYPEPVGLAATFDASGIHTMAAQIGIEGRIKHVQNLREGHTGIMGGLDFWSPKRVECRDRISDTRFEFLPSINSLTYGLHDLKFQFLEVIPSSAPTAVPKIPEDIHLAFASTASEFVQ